LNKFPKKERLSSKKLIKELFSKGSSFFLYPFKIFYLANYPESTPAVDQVLISVPKKHFKSAVKRNSVRRKIKEAYRLNKPVIKESDRSLYYIIGFVYISKDILPYNEIDLKLKAILKRLSETKANN
jgi:ribonuclease P protein component